MPSNRSNAKKWTLAAQALLGAGALGLGGAAFVALPGASQELLTQDRFVLPTLDDATQGQYALAAPVRADAGSTAARLARVANRPTIAPPQVDPAQTTPIEVTPPPPTGPSISYLGCVTIGTSKRGLIGVDGRQRFVGVGDKVQDLSVEDVQDTFILIGGQRYELPQREGSVLSRATSQPTSPLMGNAGSPMMASKPMPFSKVQNVRNQGGFGAGIGKGDNRVVDGFLRVPEFVQNEDIDLWRRVRAEMLMSGKYDRNELDQIAAKMLEERRGEVPRPMSGEEREAERRHFNEFGSGDKGSDRGAPNDGGRRQ